jgi:protein O-mannosyl-transferase
MICEARDDLVIGVAVFMVALIVYANSLGNGFVWDDDVVILANSALKGNPLALFSGIDSGRPSELTPYYRPLTLLSFLIEGRIHGFTPFLVRLFNVLLHAANSFLVYRFVRSFNLNRSGALVAGLLFAVHPLNSEAVDFNSGGRNTMLAAFFVLGSYLVQQWSVRQASLAGACGGAALFLAGLFSKETALALLPFIGAMEISCHRNDDPSSGRKAFVRLLPYIACSVVYLMLRNNALSRAGVSVDIFPGLAARLLDNVYIIPRYLLNVVWPGLLSPKYFVPDDFHLYAMPLVAAWLCIIAVLWWLFTRGRSLPTLFGLAWLIAFWLPISGIFPIPSAPLADRYLYLPAIGLWLLVADQFGQLIPPLKKIRNWWIAAAVMILMVLAVVTVRHNPTWRNDIVLFTRLVELYPERAYGHHNLGCAYLDKAKDLDLAERSFERTLALDPVFPRLRTQMGYVRLLRRDYEGAIDHYNQAIYQNPLDAEALLNRGESLERLGRLDEALESYHRFLETPGNELSGARISVRSKVDALSRRTGRGAVLDN